MNTAIAEKPAAQQQRPMDTFRQQLEQRLSSLAEALPPHVRPELFKATINRAVTADPGLLAADRVSLFEACLAAAIDGLLPDKKQAALVVYKTKVNEDGKEFWIKKVQYMPMIRGVFDKLYQTGQVKIAKTAIVYGGDRFRTWTDDSGDHIEYEEGEEQDRDYIRAAFALVVMKDGGVFVETMKPAEIEKIRSKSKTGQSGPWVEWWEEMAKKSVFRRLSKRLPMARDLEGVTREDVFENFADDPQLADHRPQRGLTPPRPPAPMLGAPVARPVEMVQTRAAEREMVDAETGEVTETTGTAQAKTEPKRKAKAEKKAEAEASSLSSKTADDADSGGGGGGGHQTSAAAATTTKARQDDDPRQSFINKLILIATNRDTAQAEKLGELADYARDHEGAFDDDDWFKKVVLVAQGLAQKELKVDEARAAMEEGLQ